MPKSGRNCMNAIGFYPVDPVSGQYDVGTPLFDSLILSVVGGRKLTIVAKHESPESIYVKSVALNGRKQTNWKLNHSDLRIGGELTFELTDAPA